MLPKHQEWAYEILLELGKRLTHQPIYVLSEKEFEILRNYIDKNLRKGFIRPSTSSAGYPIFCALKKDGKLRLRVDYQQLNAITIKNQYGLEVISELQMRISEEKIFTKIDI